VISKNNREIFAKKIIEKHNKLIEKINEMHTIESTHWHMNRP